MWQKGNQSLYYRGKMSTLLEGTTCRRENVGWEPGSLPVIQLRFDQQPCGSTPLPNSEGRGQGFSCFLHLATNLLSFSCDKKQVPLLLYKSEQKKNEEILQLQPQQRQTVASFPGRSTIFNLTGFCFRTCTWSTWKTQLKASHTKKIHQAATRWKVDFFFFQAPFIEPQLLNIILS